MTTGGCLCGAIRFEITLPTRFCAHCNCGMCRRAHGAPLVTWVGVPSAQFRITRGSGELRVYHSSPAARRSFCNSCGNMLLFEGDRWPNEVHVARAAIEGDIDREASVHTYWDERASWFCMRDELPKLGGENGVQPLDQS